jgi:hypothetical protein
MWEIEIPEFADGRFNSQRASVPSESERLECRGFGRKALMDLFRSVGRWCTELGQGRVHLEWGLEDNTLWLFQLDFEDQQPDEGVNPDTLIRPDDGLGVGNLPEGTPIHIADFRGDTGWRKIDKVKEFLIERTSP